MVDTSNSVWLCPAFFYVYFGDVCSLTADMARYQATKPNQPYVRCLRPRERGSVQYSTVEAEVNLVYCWRVSKYAAKWTRSFSHLPQEKGGLPIQVVTTEWEKSLFLVHARISLPVSGFRELLHFGIYFILFYFYFFLISTAFRFTILTFKKKSIIFTATTIRLVISADAQGTLFNFPNI